MSHDLFTFETTSRILHLYHGHGTVISEKQKSEKEESSTDDPIEYKVEFDQGFTATYTENELTRIAIPHHINNDDGSKSLIVREEIELYVSEIVEKKGNFWNATQFLSNLLRTTNNMRNEEIEAAYKERLNHDLNNVVGLTMDRAFDLIIDEIWKEK